MPEGEPAAPPAQAPAQPPAPLPAQPAPEAEPDLPRALVRKIVKAKLAPLEPPRPPGNDADGAKRPDVHINKDALLAFAEGAKVFINYLTATASDLCKEAKRQTLSAEDVLGALQDLDFAEFIPPVRDALEAFRRDSKEKSKRKAELNKKRKAEGPEQASLQADPLAAVLEEGLDPDLDVGADLADHQAHGQAAFKAPDAGYAEEALDPVPAIPEALLH